MGRKKMFEAGTEVIPRRIVQHGLFMAAAVLNLEHLLSN